MIKLRTEIERIPLRQQIGCREGILLLGSCFTEHVGEWLAESWLPVMCNPWGVLFNPASIAQSLGRVLALCDAADSHEFELCEKEGRYYSFQHHGSHSGTDARALATHLKALDAQVVDFWQKARHLLVTFGTSWVFERDGVVVANCHKFPAQQFVRRRLSVDEIVASWRPIIEADATKHFVFTVSPIRHIKDTLHGNQLSKATLHLAVEQLCALYPNQVEYLPVYELLVDDLRDYRYYADDLVHPSSMAIQLVREYVSDVALNAELRQFLKLSAPIVKAMQHRPSDPDSPAYQQFLRETLQRKDALLAQFGV